MATIDDIIQLINDNDLDIEYGDLDNDTFLVVQSWQDYYQLHGLINGFTGLRDKPYRSKNETLVGLLIAKTQELESALKDNPTHHGTHSRIKSEISDINNWILYSQYLSINNIDETSLDDIADISWGFADEYSRCACGNCSNIVRTSPDCYEWTPPLFLEAEGYISDECSESGNFDNEILEQYANEQKSLPDCRDPEDLGLIKINDQSFENGWYGGQNDTPEPIIEALNKHDIDVWFKVYPRQFDLDFDVYVKQEHENKAREILNSTDTALSYDPKDQLAKGLKAASKAMAELPDSDGIKHATIDTDTGTATAKAVPKEDFIKGIK